MWFCAPKVLNFNIFHSFRSFLRGTTKAWWTFVARQDTKHDHHHHHHRFYSLLQALTAPIMLFHWLRSCALFLHPWIPRTRRSCSTLSIHLIWGLPFFFLPSIFVNVTFLHGSVSLARYSCPSHLRLPAFITFNISLSSYSWYSSWLYLLRQLPFVLTGSYIFLSIFLSNIFNLLSSVFVNAQLSLP
jgi:hypothetical protein